MEYINSLKIGVDKLTEFGEKLRIKKVFHGIMIIPGTLSNAAKQALLELEEDKFLYLEYFEEKQLYVNITHHELVPKHTLLSDEEKKILIEK